MYVCIERESRERDTHTEGGVREFRTQSVLILLLLFASVLPSPSPLTVFESRAMEPWTPDWSKAPHSMGTTIMAVKYNGGVILGADSRTSTGAYVANRASDKITSLTDNVYLCRSGSAADSQIVSDYVRHFLHQHTIQLGRPANVKTAASLIRELSYSNKSLLQAGLIVAGWDKYDGGSIYGVPLGGTLLSLPFATGGSGSSYLYGYLDQAWKEDMSKEEAEALVIKAVSLAIARDSGSGGVVRTVVINEQGVTRNFYAGNKLPIWYEEIPGQNSLLDTANEVEPMAT